MIRKTKICFPNFKWAWGFAVFCDTPRCNTKLRRYKPWRNDENRPADVEDGDKHLCTHCERENRRADNEAQRAKQIAERQAQEKTDSVREQNRARKRRQRAREKMSRSL